MTTRKMFSLAIACLCLLSCRPSSKDDAGLVRDALINYARAVRDHDVAKMRDSFAADTAEQQNRLDALVDSLRTADERHEAQSRLGRAVASKFADRTLDPPAPATQPENDTLIESAEVTVTGDNASLEIIQGAGTPRSFSQLYRLVRRSGAWKISLDSPMFVKGGPAASRIASQNKAFAEAYSQTSADVEAGKLPTLDAVKEELRLKQIKEFAKAQETAQPMKNGGGYVWDLTKSHTPADVHWPKEATGWNWLWDSKVDQSARTLDVRLAGLNPIKMDVVNWTVTNTDHKEKLDQLSFGMKDRISAAEVGALVERIGFSDSFRKQLAGWPPANVGNTLFTFHQPLADGGEVFLTILNAAKFTGEKDSWDLSFRADWQMPPGYWDQLK